jgi:hypothetical protein
VDRLALAPDVMLESTFAGRRFEVETNGTSLAPMVYAPQSQSGAYFNDHERHVSSLQWVEAISLARDWRGSHVFKGGIDLQRSRFDGESASRSVEIRRLDGSLAERIVFGSPSTQEVHGTEVGAFVQDRWRLASRLTFELGLRLDRDAVVEGWSWSPRGGVAVSVLPEGRAILRGGIGKFVQRTPLNLDAFTSFESRVATRYDAAGNAANPVALAHVMVQRLTTPRAIVGSIEWDQRFGRRLIFKTAFLLREGSHEFILSPDPGRGELRLSSSGTSQYKELEATGRYLGGGRRDLTASYVWSRGSADLNNYDQFFGNMRNPIVRANGYGPIPTDVRHRFLLRGTIGLPARWDVAPVLEIRSGFPWSAVDEYQDFVGPRNLAGRLPIVRSLDLAISRPWAFRRYQFRAGVRLYNIFGASAYRDVQSNVTAPDYGAFYNPIERSVGFTFSAIR